MPFSSLRNRQSYLNQRANVLLGIAREKSAAQSAQSITPAPELRPVLEPRSAEELDCAGNLK
jgi:hypothetical protein